MAAVWLSFAGMSRGLARAGHPSRGSDPVAGLARISSLLLEVVAALAQAGQRRPGGVGKPAGRLDKLPEACALLPLQQADDEVRRPRTWRSTPASTSRLTKPKLQLFRPRTCCMINAEF